MEYLANLDVADRTGKTALHHAAYNGHVQMLSLLLLKGASVKTTDRSDRTPLHYAAFHGLSLSLSPLSPLSLSLSLSLITDTVHMYTQVSIVCLFYELKSF